MKKSLIGFISAFALSTTAFLFAGFHSMNEAKALADCPAGQNFKCESGNCKRYPCGWPNPPGPYFDSCMDLGATCQMGVECNWAPEGC